MAALIIAIFPQNSSRGNWEEQQDRTDPNSQFELARKPAWLLAFRQFGLPKWKHDFECGPFNRLGTSPNIKLCACTLREMLSGGHRFTEYLLCHTFSCFAREKRRRGRKGPIFKKMIGKLKNFLDISRISYIIIWLAVCRQILALI